MLVTTLQCWHQKPDEMRCFVDKNKFKYKYTFSVTGELADSETCMFTQTLYTILTDTNLNANLLMQEYQ